MYIARIFTPCIHALRQFQVVAQHQIEHVPRPIPWQQLLSSNISRGMKRKALDSSDARKLKRPREQLPDYCDVEPVTDDHEGIVWPAPRKAIEAAQGLLKAWYAWKRLIYKDIQLIEP